MTTLIIIFRRARTLLWTALSILIILAAVLVGVGKLLMPYSVRYQPELEAWLSEEFGRPVELKSFEGEWKAFGPRLSLHGMNLLSFGEAGADGPGGVVIESAALDIKPLNALLPGKPLYNFRVIGADFQLLRTPQGRYELSGFGVSGRGSPGDGSALSELARIGEVILQDSSLGYRDEARGIYLDLASIQGRLQMDGEDFSTEVRARFKDPNSGRVYGDIEATLLLTLNEGQGLADARWQVSVQELMLAALQGRVPANPFMPVTGWLNSELWGEWSKDSELRVQGVADLRDARLVNDHQDLTLEHLNSRLNWRYDGKADWRLDLHDLLFDDGDQAWAAPGIALARNMEQDLGLWISADYLPLQAPLNFARNVMSVYGTRWPAFLPEAAAGDVDDLELVLDSKWRLKLASGRVRDASLFDWDRWPDLSGLDGEVALYKGSGGLSLRSADLLVQWPQMFREDLNFRMPACQLDLRWGAGWQVGFNECSLENDDLALSGEIVMSSNEGRPAVDVNVFVPRGRVGQLDAYWPQGIIKEKVLNWLRRGLVGGEIDGGRFQIYGDMDHWPFRQGQGRFEAVAHLRDVELDYVEGWPLARDVDAVARFAGASMQVEGSVGNIGGVAVQSARAEITDLKTPVLQVSYSSATDVPGLIGFIGQTPLQERIDTDLSAFQFSGPALTTGSLRQALGLVESEMEVKGRVEVDAAGFADPGSGIALSGIAGELLYDQQGFVGTGLTAQFSGSPALLDLSGGGDQSQRFRAVMRGVFEITDIIPDFLLEGYAALAQVEGHCAWDVSMVVDSGESGARAGAMLLIQSDLESVEIDLPAPLDKKVGDTWPLRLSYPLSGATRLLDMTLEDRVTFRFEIPEEADNPSRAVIALGGGPAELPAAGFLNIEGRAPDLDIDGWIDVIIEGAEQGKSMGGLVLENGSLGARRLRFLDRYFADVDMEIEAGADEIKARFSGTDIDGRVSFTGSDEGARSLSAEFERLALADPITSGLDMESDPADLPALHLYARSFKYSGIELGETRIEAYPTPTGFHFEKVEAQSEQLSVRASGDWRLKDHSQRSDFSIHMTAESLGDFLESLDFSSSVQGGQTVVRFNAWWPGPPSAFALSRLNGEVDFSVHQGQITNASAGTGRLLGLLSIQALPRRLALDFRDVFDSGFDFDEASGSFVMENGRASTDDVALKSSVASINVSGSTDLVAQEYDQLLTVKPGLGNTLPIIGAIAGGPGGAAAGLALQGLLHEQLGEAMQVQYTITGSWEEPSIDPVEKTAPGG
jgi:uncharacterized protein (TIGR02099 family)